MTTTAVCYIDLPHILWPDRVQLQNYSNTAVIKITSANY